MAQNVTLRARGLFSFPNVLSEVPEGSLSQASNIVIDRDGVISPRRGFDFYGTEASAVLKQLLVYKGRILRHFATTLDVDSDGAGTSFSTLSTDVAEVSSGLRIKYLEANGNFYFTTSAGIKKLSASTVSAISSAPVTQAGGIKALDGVATLNSDLGFFTQDSVTAYRTVWGIKDANTNVILGVPGERIEITNSLLSLLIADFNTLVDDLAAVVASGSGGTLSDTDYTTRKISVNASDIFLRSSLSSLATKVGTDLTNPTIASFGPATGTITANTVATATEITTSASHGLSTGQLVTIAGNTSTSVTPINGTFSITVTAVNKFTIPVDVSVAGNNGTWSITGAFPDVTLGTEGNPTATTAQLETLQSVFDNFIGEINSDTGITSKSAIGGSFLTSSQSATVDLTFTIPSGITTAHFYQVYRSEVASSTGPNRIGDGNTVASAEYKLIYEVSPTTAEIVAQSVTFHDTVSEDVRNAGTPLYTNDISGEGSLQTNDAPPLASDIASFKGSTFYSNTSTKYSLTMSLLSVLGIEGLSILITQGTTTDFYTFVQNIAQVITVTVDAGSVFPTSGTSPYLDVYSANSTNHYRIWFQVGTSVAPVAGGGTLVQCSLLAGDTTAQVATKLAATVSTLSDFLATATATTVLISNQATGYATAPFENVGGTFAVATTITGTGEDAANNKIGFTSSLFGSISNISTAATKVITTVGNHELTTGQVISIVGSDTSPSIDGNYTVTVTGATTFTIASVITSAIGTAGDWATYPFLSPAQQVDEAARSLVRVINKNSSGVINAFYISGPNDVPGIMQFEAREIGDAEFYVTAENSTIGALFNPTISPTLLISSIGASSPRLVTTSTAHGMATGAQVIITNPGTATTSSDLIGIHTITLVSPTSFTIPVTAGSSGTGGYCIPLASAEDADNEVVPNRLYYSKYQQPEAVPTLNYIDIGPKDKAILRIIALRDSLFIMTESAIYRLSGENTQSFVVSLFDGSTQLQATDSAVALNNKIYMMSDGGVVGISDTGTDVISRPIENLLVPLLIPAYAAFSTATFAVAYESDRCYMLYTVVNPSDTTATVCYRFNTFTNTWVSWDMEKTCGVINPSTNALYVGAADVNFVEKERKNYNRTDHADRSYVHDIPEGGVSGNILSVGSLFEVKAGDVLVQTQYLTLSQYNRLLKKLDLDPSVSYTDYYSTLGVTSGCYLRADLDDLAAKLDTDPGINDSDYAAAISGVGTTFADTQSAFNIIIAKLNLDIGVAYNNYTPSTGIVVWEVGVDATSLIGPTITLDYAVPFIAGPFTTFKGISSLVVWSPHAFGDPSMGKHVFESTILFENTAFTHATAAFSSDFNPGFTSIPINGSGTGCWGTFNFGQEYFGGSGTSRPFRTYVPQRAQRCRYINGKYTHMAAREQWDIFGLSFTFETTSMKTSR